MRPSAKSLSPLLQGQSQHDFIGAAGLGKSHSAAALAYEGCLAGHTVLFTKAIDIVNALVAAQSAHRLKADLKNRLDHRDDQPAV